MVYLVWLLGISFISSTFGWFFIYVLAENVEYWLLPLFFIINIIFTVNGDNLVESIVILAILGVLFFLLGTNEAIYEFKPVLIGFYASLVTSKVFFAFAKEGALGNKKFY